MRQGTGQNPSQKEGAGLIPPAHHMPAGGGVGIWKIDSETDQHAERCCLLGSLGGTEEKREGWAMSRSPWQTQPVLHRAPKWDKPLSSELSKRRGESRAFPHTP